MGKRAHSVVVSQAPVPSPQDVSVSVEEAPAPALEVDLNLVNLKPFTLRLLPLFTKINTKGYFTAEEFDRICFIVAGDKRRALLRLLLGLYQRALLNHDGEEASRARFMLTLHEDDRLEENLLLGAV